MKSKNTRIRTRKRRHLLSTLTCAMAIVRSTIQAAEPPNTLHYQGLIQVGTAAFEGTGHFKFAFVNADGTTTYWSNDGSSSAGSEPAAAVSMTVGSGRYNVQLGGSAMQAIPADLFKDFGDAHLRVWFNDGVNGFEQLSPDQPLSAVAYARHAATAGSANTFSGTNLDVNGTMSVDRIALSDTSPVPLEVNTEGFPILQFRYASDPSYGGITSTDAPQPILSLGYGHTFGGETSSGFVGGHGNTLDAELGFIGGGSGNHVRDRSTTIGGGSGNTITYGYGTIAGGRGNTVEGSSATIPGGRANKALGGYSFAAGLKAEALHLGSFVWQGAAGTDNAEGDPNATTAFQSTAPRQFLVNAPGGFGINKNDPATALDVNGIITADGLHMDYAENSTPLEIQTDGFPTLQFLYRPDRDSNGDITSADEPQPILSLGYGHTIDRWASGFLSGFEHEFNAQLGFIGGGSRNHVSDRLTTISGGSGNTVLQQFGTISGGRSNTVDGDTATIPGGRSNQALAGYSFAAGLKAEAHHFGSFVWQSGQNPDFPDTTTPFQSTAPQQFLVNAPGGFGINKNDPATALDVNGTVTATAFTGDGSGLTGIDVADNDNDSENELQYLQRNGTSIRLSGVIQAPISIADNDNDASNELQYLQRSGTSISLSGVSQVPISIADNDNDSSNELQDLSDVLSRGNNAGNADMRGLNIVNATRFTGELNANANVKLNGNYLSNDGDDEGIRITSAGDVTIEGLRPVGSTKSTSIVAGKVTEGGNKVSGTTQTGGYSVNRNATGEYIIVFDDGTFSKEPAITVTVESGSSPRVTTVERDNSEFNRFTVRVFNMSGNARNENFSFTAIGER